MVSTNDTPYQISPASRAFAVLFSYKENPNTLAMPSVIDVTADTTRFVRSGRSTSMLPQFL